MEDDIDTTTTTLEKQTVTNTVAADALPTAPTNTTPDEPLLHGTGLALCGNGQGGPLTQAQVELCRQLHGSVTELRQKLTETLQQQQQQQIAKDGIDAD